jgi:hypothetical protein
MPPQQPDRLLDGIDIRLGFRAHEQIVRGYRYPPGRVLENRLPI